MTEPQWIIARPTLPRGELRAERELARLGFRTMLPKEEKRARYRIGNRRRPAAQTIYVPMMPGYIFVLAGNDFGTLLAQRHLIRALVIGGRVARLLPDDAQRLNAVSRDTPGQAGMIFSVGDSAVIVAGAGEGCEGLVEAIAGNTLIIESRGMKITVDAALCDRV